MKRILVILIILLLVFLLSEWLIPPLITQNFREVLFLSLDRVEELVVEIESFPAFFLLLGQADDLYLAGEGVEIQGLTIHSWEGRHDNLRFPPIWKWQSEDWEITGSNSFIEIQVKEEDLNNYIQSTFEDLLQLRISLLEEGVHLYTDLEVYNMALQAKIEGFFQVAGPQRVDFVPRDISIENFKLPDVMVEYLMEELDFYLDLTEIPLPIHVTDVITLEGEVFFRGGERE